MDRPNTPIAILISTLAALAPLEGYSTEPEGRGTSVEDRIITYLRPYRTIEIMTSEQGAVEEIHVERGSFVKKGDILLMLDSDLFEARLAVARAEAESTGVILAAEAEEKLNRDRLSVLSKLKSRGSANEAELERQAAQLSMSEANVVSAREQQEVAGLRARMIQVELDRRIIRSPTDGIVVEVSVDQGESVSQSSTLRKPLLIIVEIDRVRAKAFVPYEAASQLDKGSKVWIQFERGEPTSVEGTIEFRSPVADPATGTVEIIARVENPGLNLPIGIPATLVLESPAAPE